MLSDCENQSQPETKPITNDIVSTQNVYKTETLLLEIWILHLWHELLKLKYVYLKS